MSPTLNSAGKSYRDFYPEVARAESRKRPRKSRLFHVKRRVPTFVSRETAWLRIEQRNITYLRRIHGRSHRGYPRHRPYQATFPRNEPPFGVLPLQVPHPRRRRRCSAATKPWFPAAIFVAGSGRSI